MTRGAPDAPKSICRYYVAKHYVIPCIMQLACSASVGRTTNIQEGRGERKIENAKSNMDNKGAGKTGNKVCMISRVLGFQKGKRAQAPFLIVKGCSRYLISMV